MTKVSALWRCPLYRESTKKSEFSKSNHETQYVKMFQVQIYWKNQKTERLKKMHSFFILKSSNKVHYISTLNYWSRSTPYLYPMNEKPFFLKMLEENNGQCREKNEKLCKVKRAGESDSTPFIYRTEYYNLSWWFV